MTDFSSPRRMSAAALVILLQKTFKELSAACFIGLGYVLFNSQDSDMWDAVLRFVSAVGAILGISFIIAFWKYYFRKYHIEGDKLIYTQGFAAKQTTSIPLSRVHTLRTKRGVFYRLLGLRGVSFDTLASDYQEVELILDERDWQMLLHRVRMGEDFAEITDSTVALPPPMEDSTQSVSDLNILKGALCQNHLKGFAVLATVAWALYDNISQLGDDATIRVLSYLDDHVGGVLPSVGECILSVAVIYMIVMILWTAKVFLRYSGMTLHIADNRLTIESGLLARYTCRLAREKTTVLAIKQNPLEKIAHCQTITLRQADNVSDTKNEGNIRIYGSALGNELLAWWLGDNSATANDSFLSAKSGKGLFMRKFAPHLILSLVLSLIIFDVTQSLTISIIIGSSYAAVTAIRAVMAWQHSGIELTEAYVRINCGNIAIIREYIKYHDIESVSIRRTPFTPATGRVSLKISTNADVFIVYSLEINTATEIRNLLLNNYRYSS